MKSSAPMRVQVGETILEKLEKPGTQLRFVLFEDLFDILHVAHIEKSRNGMSNFAKKLLSGLPAGRVNQLRIQSSTVHLGLGLSSAITDSINFNLY